MCMVVRGTSKEECGEVIGRNGDMSDDVVVYDNDEIVWQCWCGYVITDIEYKSLRCDVGCPRCHRSLSEFSSRKWSDV